MPLLFQPSSLFCFVSGAINARVINRVELRKHFRFIIVLRCTVQVCLESSCRACYSFLRMLQPKA
jgi:hypothetical protein